MKKLFTFLSIIILSISCSKEDPAPTVKTPALTNFELKGLFRMDTSFSIDDDNLLFENNKLFISTEANSIHQTLAVGDNLLDDAVPYIFNTTTNKVNFTFSSRLWEGTYESTTGKIINGVVKSSNGVTVLGSFTAQKYIPQASGANLFNGHWKGKYGVGTAAPDSFFNLIIENGTVVVLDGQEHSLNSGNTSGYGLSLSAPGINDKTITCLYQYISGDPYSFQATYNPTTKKLQGTWGFGINTSGGGTVIFEPQNFN